MDRLTVISGALFVAADVFAIISLAMPDWIVTDVGGKLYAYNDFLWINAMLLTHNYRLHAC
jgi:hypothetical protein